MISVKRLADASGKQFYLVESRLPDGTLQCITRSYKFRCNTRGFEDRDARSKALRFAITTDTLPLFRAFIFSEVDGAAPGRNEGGVRPLVPARSDAHLPVGPAQEGLARRIRSYVCMRQNRLTGLRFVVAMSRLDSGRLRAISFQDHSLGGAGNSDEALNKAVRFLRGVAFESWRKQAANELMSRDRDGVGNRRERALKHVSAFVEIEAGEKVDCACGKNRSRGLMVACERCGAWEHAECQGFRSDKQIPADYICSACMRAEREDVVVIRLDEQGECGNLQLEDLWTDTKIKDREGDDGVCCVCGCEDNQDFENMIPPENEHDCDGGTALAHPSCISAAQQLSHKAWNGKAMAAGMCQLCGDRFMRSPRGNEEVYSHTSSGVSQSKPKKGSLSPNQSHTRNSRRAAKLDQSARGAKRLRSALTNGGVVAKQEVVDKRPAKSAKEEENEVQATQSGEKMELVSPEATNKSSVPQVGTTLPDRRFNDAAVTVPIKKRRLMMMMEAARSPSPPPSPPPQVENLVVKDELVEEQKDIETEAAAQVLQDAEMVEASSGEQVSAETNVASPRARIGSSESPKMEPVVDDEPVRKSPLVVGSKFENGSDVSEVEGSQEAAAVHEKNHVSVPAAVESKLQEMHSPDLVTRDDDGLATQESSDSKNSADGHMHNNGKDESDNVSGQGGGQHVEANQSGDAENKDAGATSSASQSRSRDVRLHWDLNMDMEEWERPPEEDTGTFSGVQQQGGPALSASPVHHEEDAADDDHKASPVAENHQTPSEHVEARPLAEVVRAVNESSDANNMGDAEEVEAEDHQAEGQAEVGGADGDASSTDAESVESKHPMETEELNSATKESSVEDYSDTLEAEHVDYDDSESRQGDEGASDAEERVESTWRENVEPGSPGQTNGAEAGGSDVEMKVGAVDEGTGQGHSFANLSGGDAREGIAVQGVGAETADADSESGGGLKHVVIPEPDLLELGDPHDGPDHELEEIHEELEIQEELEEIQEGLEIQDGIEIHEGIEILEGTETLEGIEEIQEGKDNLPTEAAEVQSSERIESVVVREDALAQEEDKEASTPGSSARRTDGQSRAKSSGWDQLPEGFDKAEDALRAVKDSPAGRGRGSTWATANGRGASISPRGGGPTTARFGRGIRSEGVVGDKPRSEDSSWTREDHQRVQRVDDNVDISPRVVSPRELGRGRSHGRGGSPAVRGRGRMEPWMDSPSGGPSSPWGGGPNRHPSPPGHFSDGFGPRGPTNAATRALLKVESSGFVVAPDGTLTKAGGSSGRGPPRPFQSGGGRNGRGVMGFNMGRGGGPGMNIGLGMNLGGLRANMGMGRGMGMGPGMGMNMGMGMGMGMNVGPGVGLGGMPGRGGPGGGGRGMVDRYSGPYGGGRGSAGGPVVEHSSSRRGRFNNNDDYSESWSRRDDRSASPRKRRSTSRRISRSATPSRSKSRTRSPKARTPPRPANSSGSGGGVVGKSNKKRSHSPAVHKLEVRGERPESSPARRSVPPPPKLPLPPPPPRSQRSPPAGLRRLTESKRDGDRARSRDRERERERERERPPSSRARTPPRRTSPHVVHGSALMDERDRQLLAGIRHVSPVNARNRLSEAPGAGTVTSSRDSPPLTSPAGRLAEGSGEARRQSGDEGVDSRIHGFKRDDMGIKAEQRGSRETSRGDRERIARRESGRDRDDERRDMRQSSYSSRDRDGRSSSSLKYNREGDDDVAPRRRRPSP